MRSFFNVAFLLLVLSSCGPIYTQAQDPIIQTIYTADPAQMAHRDTLCLHTGHDEDRSTWFIIQFINQI